MSDRPTKPHRGTQASARRTGRGGYSAAQATGPVREQSGAAGEARCRRCATVCSRLHAPKPKQDRDRLVKATPRRGVSARSRDAAGVLRELKATLQTTRAGVPVWLDAMQQQFQTFTGGLQEELRRVVQRWMR